MHYVVVYDYQTCILGTLCQFVHLRQFIFIVHMYNHTYIYIYMYILGYMQRDFMVFDRCISNYPVNDVTNVNDFLILMMIVH